MRVTSTKPRTRVLRSEEPRPFRHNLLVDRHRAVAEGRLEFIQGRKRLGRAVGIGAPTALPAATFLKEGHDADPQSGVIDRRAPGPDVDVPAGCELAQDVLVEEIDRHGISCGVIASSGSLSTSHTPASARSPIMRLKLRAG